MHCFTINCQCFLVSINFKLIAGPDDGPLHSVDQLWSPESRLRLRLHQVSHLLRPPRGEGQNLVLFQDGSQGWRKYSPSSRSFLVFVFYFAENAGVLLTLIRMTKDEKRLNALKCLKCQKILKNI